MKVYVFLSFFDFLSVYILKSCVYLKYNLSEIFIFEKKKIIPCCCDKYSRWNVLNFNFFFFVNLKADAMLSCLMIAGNLHFIFFFLFLRYLQTDECFQFFIRYKRDNRLIFLISSPHVRIKLKITRRILFSLKFSYKYKHSSTPEKKASIQFKCKRHIIYGLV